MQKSKKGFLHDTATDLRYMLRNFQLGLSKQNLEKKSVFCKKGVEVGQLDGTPVQYDQSIILIIS
jgi:hypothetical protein